MNMEYVWAAILWGFKSEMWRRSEQRRDREKPAIWVKEKLLREKKRRKKISQIIPSTASYLNHY